MALAQGRDKLSALLLIVGMAAVALGVRAWPHRFLEARPLARQERGWIAPAREAPVTSTVTATAPAMVLPAASVPAAATSARNRIHPVRQGVAPPPAARIRMDIDRETPAALLPSRPLTIAASIIRVHPAPASSADPSLGHAGEALGHAFASAGRRTARAFTRAF